MQEPSHVFYSLPNTPDSLPIQNRRVEHTESQLEPKQTPESDMVNHPAHYNQFSQEVIVTIKEWIKGYTPVVAYLLANVLKYISRAPFKGNMLRDIKKAQFYLNEAVQELENEQKGG